MTALCFLPQMGSVTPPASNGVHDAFLPPSSEVVHDASPALASERVCSKSMLPTCEKRNAKLQALCVSECVNHFLIHLYVAL